MPKFQWPGQKRYFLVMDIQHGSLSVTQALPVLCYCHVVSKGRHQCSNRLQQEVVHPFHDILLCQDLVKWPQLNYTGSWVVSTERKWRADYAA